MIEVYRVGTMVDIRGATAQVLAVTLRETCVTYLVTWWNEGNRNEQWIASCEIVGQDEKTKIGFKI